MQLHIQTRRPNKWPSSGSNLLKASPLSALILLVVLVSGSEAIVKQQQQQQRSDDSQQQQAANQQSHHQQQSAYNNHQQQQQASGASAVPNSLVSLAQQQSSQQQPSSYSSSVSISSSSQSSPSAAASSSSSAAGGSSPTSGSLPVLSSSSGSAPNSQQSSGRASEQLSSYGGGYGSSSVQQQQQQAGPKYIDSMSAAASNPEQSYQAAANGVNMALANSGILGYGPSSASAGGVASGAGGQNQQQVGGAHQQPAQLNPLHYFYYPAKESGSSGQQQQANSASSNYNAMASYPSYADQLSSALSSMGSIPEAAASSLDASYLPQPAGSGDSVGQSYNGQQPNGGQQQQHGQAQSGYQGADLSSYASNMNQQQQPAVAGQPGAGSSISFNGPSSSGASSSSSSVVGSQPNGMNDYMNSHLGGGAGHQQVSPLSAYQANNLFNQMGDLSTSNFGNNAGGLSSVTSYMSPNGAHHPGSSGSHGAVDSLFSGLTASSGGQSQFSSAASQLSQAAVSPPQQQQQQPQGSSLFGASSLFGQQASGQQQQQQHQQNPNLFSPNQQYLNSLFSNQFGGSQGQTIGDQGMLSSASSVNPATASSAAAPSGSGSAIASTKRWASYIMPMLAIAGLSLLIPTMSNIGTAVGRKKRSIEDKATSSSRQQQIAYDSMNGGSQFVKEMSIGEYMDKIERYYSIYKNAVENDDCLNRLICEFGDAVKDVAGKSAVVTVIEKLVPTWMTGKVHLFKEAALSNKEGKEKCKKYTCHGNKHQK